MKYEVAAREWDGEGYGRAAPDNRVIFTRDLGGDFAREERAASLFRSRRLPALTLFPSTPLEDSFPASLLSREIRPVEAISM